MTRSERRRRVVRILMALSLFRDRYDNDADGRVACRFGELRRALRRSLATLSVTDQHDLIVLIDDAEIDDHRLAGRRLCGDVQQKIECAVVTGIDWNDGGTWN